MQGQHLYLQDRHEERSQKKKQKQKKKKKNHEDCNSIKECGKKIGAEGELQELKKKKKKKTSPAHPSHRPLPDSKTEMPVPPNVREFDKIHKKKEQTYQSPRLIC